MSRSNKLPSLLLVLAANLANAMLFDGPEPTVIKPADEHGWTPKPTQCALAGVPEDDLFGNLKRGSQFGGICGYVSGVKSSSISCYGTSVCATNSPHQALACCNPVAIAACTIPYECIASSALKYCNSDCQNDGHTLKCSDSSNGECVTLSYNYPGAQITGLVCGPTHSTALVETTYTQTSTASTEQSGGSGVSSTNVGAIAGGVVGGVVFLAIVIGLIVFFFLRNKKKKKREANEKGYDRRKSSPQPNDSASQQGYPQSPQLQTQSPPIQSPPMQSQSPPMHVQSPPPMQAQFPPPMQARYPSPPSQSPPLQYPQHSPQPSPPMNQQQQQAYFPQAYYPPPAQQQGNFVQQPQQQPPQQQQQMYGDNRTSSGYSFHGSNAARSDLDGAGVSAAAIGAGGVAGAAGIGLRSIYNERSTTQTPSQVDPSMYEEPNTPQPHAVPYPPPQQSPPPQQQPTPQPQQRWGPYNSAYYYQQQSMSANPTPPLQAQSPPPQIQSAPYEASAVQSPAPQVPAPSPPPPLDPNAHQVVPPIEAPRPQYPTTEPQTQVYPYGAADSSNDTPRYLSASPPPNVAASFSVDRGHMNSSNTNLALPTEESQMQTQTQTMETTQTTQTAAHEADSEPIMTGPDGRQVYEAP